MTLENILPALTDRVTKADTLGKTLKFDFGEKQLYIDGTGPQNILTSDNKDAECLVLVSEENFLSMVNGDLNPMAAVMTGKVKIKGDMGVAMKLNSLFG
jgi:putative sterol carrier protein